MTILYVQANYGENPDDIVASEGTGDSAPTKQVQLQVDDGHADGHINERELAIVLENIAGAIRRTSLASS